jgi:hypothetical protein
MKEPEAARAIDAVTTTARQLDLRVDDAIVLHDSNKIALRLLPADVVARVARTGEEVLQREVDVVQGLAATRSPVAALDPRIAPRVYERDGFAFTFWTYHEPAATGTVSPTGYATALAQLHTGLRTLDVEIPHFTDRVAEAQEVVANRDLSPGLGDGDRALLSEALHTQRRTVCACRAAEQPLHGEPHPGNLLSTTHGPVFVDFETCCRGPVEFDLAHAPEAVGASYPGANEQLLRECRHLVLAMVAAWRCEARDQLPNREEARRWLFASLRAGPPWPTLDKLTPPRTE